MKFELVSDQELVRKARGGDRDAFGALVLRYQEQTVMIANSILRNMEQAKEASQNAFVKAYLALSRFREEAQFKTWLFRIVINEAKDVRRRESARGFFKFLSEREDEDENAEPFLECVVSPDESPREVLEATERRKLLEQAVHELPEREREVVLLHYFHQLTLAEVAETLQIATGTVKAHLAHAIEKLRHLVVKVGGLVDERRKN